MVSDASPGRGIPPHWRCSGSSPCRYGSRLPCGRTRLERHAICASAGRREERSPMSTSFRSHRRPVGRGMLGLAATIAVIGTFLIPVAISPTPALADTSTGSGTGVECANDNWQAETTADNAGHVYVFYTNYCSNHDFLWFQVSNDGGQTFGPAQTLCSALGAACTVPQANTHTIGGGGRQTEGGTRGLVGACGGR